MPTEEDSSELWEKFSDGEGRDAEKTQSPLGKYERLASYNAGPQDTDTQYSSSVDASAAAVTSPLRYTADARKPDAFSVKNQASNHQLRSPAGFHIPDTQHSDNLQKGQQRGLKHWSYRLYRGPNGEKVKIHYCKTRNDTESVARLFLNEEVVGFDIEWKPSASPSEGIKKNVSLIQIACETRIALFHIARFRGEDSVENLVAPTFKELMESQRVTKAGVSIKGDCTRLRRFMGIDSRGLFELSYLYKLVKYSVTDANSIDKKLVKLATQVKEHLGLPLWKGFDVRVSDWSDGKLDYKQVKYAASDSYAGLQLYYTLEQKRKSLDPVPPRPYHAELNLPIRLSSGQTISTDEQPVDVDNDLPPIAALDEVARDLLSLNIGKAATPSKAPKRSDPQASSSTQHPATAAYLTAQQWMTAYRASRPKDDEKLTAPPTALRAYALWHEQGFSVPETAAALRTPPLQDATVASYVLEALSKERLPYEKARLEDVVVGYLAGPARARFAGWLRRIGVSMMA